MYKLSKNTNNKTVVIKDNQNGTTTSFIEDPANTDYAAYLAWLEAGNTPDPAPIPEPPVPLTPAEKLAASGLTVAELKALLGIN